MGISEKSMNPIAWGLGISEKSMNPIAFYSKTLFTFVASYHANASPQGEERTGGMTYMKKAFT